MHGGTRRHEKPFSAVQGRCDVAHFGDLGHSGIQIRPLRVQARQYQRMDEAPAEEALLHQLADFARLEIKKHLLFCRQGLARDRGSPAHGDGAEHQGYRVIGLAAGTETCLYPERSHPSPLQLA
jgi:hypothetical protein